jgi:murein DD-endopeptidase MepM/ murein hydrolase activator NlpD
MAKKGAPIYSVASGRVVEVSNRGLGGNNVTILGTDNRYYYYAHMNEYPLVSVGATVKSGQRIGSVGDTGNAAGRPHLHLGIGDRITTGNGDSRGGAGVNFNVPAFLNRLIDSAYKR